MGPGSVVFRPKEVRDQETELLEEFPAGALVLMKGLMALPAKEDATVGFVWESNLEIMVGQVMAVAPQGDRPAADPAQPHVQGRHQGPHLLPFRALVVGVPALWSKK